MAGTRKVVLFGGERVLYPWLCENRSTYFGVVGKGPCSLLWSGPIGVGFTHHAKDDSRSDTSMYGVSCIRTPLASPHFPFVPVVSVSSERAVALETSNTRVALGRGCMDERGVFSRVLCALVSPCAPIYSVGLAFAGLTTFQIYIYCTTFYIRSFFSYC